MMTYQEIAVTTLRFIYNAHVDEILLSLKENLIPDEPQSDYDKIVEDRFKRYVKALIHDSDEIEIIASNLLSYHVTENNHHNSYEYLKALKELDEVYNKYYPIICEVKNYHVKGDENA